MFASFALFINDCHTVNDDHAVFNQRVGPRITGTGSQIEKPGKVTRDDSLSLDTTTITLYIIDH